MGKHHKHVENPHCTDCVYRDYIGTELWGKACLYSIINRELRDVPPSECDKKLSNKKYKLWEGQIIPC